MLGLTLRGAPWPRAPGVSLMTAAKCPPCLLTSFGDLKASSGLLGSNKGQEVLLKGSAPLGSSLL